MDKAEKLIGLYGQLKTSGYLIETRNPAQIYVYRDFRLIGVTKSFEEAVMLACADLYVDYHAWMVKGDEPVEEGL